MKDEMNDAQPRRRVRHQTPQTDKEMVQACRECVAAHGQLSVLQSRWLFAQYLQLAQQAEDRPLIEPAYNQAITELRVARQRISFLEAQIALLKGEPCGTLR